MNRQLTLIPSRFKRVYGGGIIRYFDKTPHDIVCPHFWELNWAYGCWFDCAYCYLQGTFHGKKRPWHRPLPQVKAILREFFTENEKPQVLNSGELADSLVFPEVMREIADEFERQDKHKLLLLTKSSNLDFLIERLRKQTIVSFSLNSSEAWKRWEHKTPPPEKRIEAASHLSRAGYEVRVRIDPIFPMENWRKHYGDLVYLMLSTLPTEPTRITLGTPRGLAKTLRFTKDRSWTRYFTENPDRSGWGKKIPQQQRKEIYNFFYDKFQALGIDKSHLALCKESTKMWKELNLNPNECRCNCVW